MVKPIPEGYSSITPYLTVKGADKALAFYAKAFGAKELFRMPMGDKVGHAEMQIGNARLMLGDESLETGAVAPKGDGRTPVAICLYVEDVDAVFKAALGAGAKELRPVQNQFYGDRSGMLTDPFGHVWNVATHVEDVSSEEMKRRMAQLAGHG
jgi:PhnB protein